MRWRMPPAWRSAGGNVPRGTVRAALLVAAALLLVAVPTLTPTPGSAGSTGICIFCGSLGGVDFSLNLALFVPLGAAIWNATGSWRHAVVAGFLVSMVIETLQFQLIAGRDATVGDVLANGLGTLTGAGIALGSRRVRDATAATARRFAAAAGLLTALLVSLAAVLLLPHQTTNLLFVQWSPVKKDEAVFRGNLESVEFNGRQLQRRDTVRAHQSIDSVTRSHVVKATVRGPVPGAPRQAVIIRLAHLEEGLQLAQRGDGVAFRAYSFASRFRLRTVQVMLDEAFPRPGAERAGTVTIEARSTPERIVVRANRQGERITSVAVPRTIGLAWAFFLPWNAAIGPDWWPANTCWIAGLMFPVSLLTGRAQRLAGPRSTSLIRWWPIAVVAVTLVVMAPLTGLSQLQPFEWLGLTVGVCGGIAFDRWLASRFFTAARAGDTTS